MKKLILILLLISPVQSFLHPQSPTVQAVINQTNIDSLVYFVRELSGDVQTIIGGTSYTILSRNKNHTDNNKAADYIKQKLSSYGLTTYDQWFSATGRNVYGVQLGTEFPNQKYIICAHYDDMPSGTAPGADDNASGTAAVIEAARIFTQYDSRYTIIYALWDEEEQGLVGSAYYALQAYNTGEQILGVINMDMISWDNDGDGVGEIHTGNLPASSALKDVMVQVNSTYSVGVTPSIRTPGTTASDHASFWNRGYPALLLIEEYFGGDFNAYYHTINDKIQYFNLPYYHKMSRLALGTAAALAVLEPSTFALSVSVANGWNMVSIPGLLPSNQNVASWWPGKDPAAGVFKFINGYLEVSTAVPGEGYWMKNLGAQVYNTGDEWPAGIQFVPNEPIPIVPGWNLFGVYECSVSAGSVTTTPAGLQSGMIIMYENGYFGASILYPGYGYWFKSTGYGFLNIPSCLESHFIAAKNTTENFGRIIFTGNRQQNYTLYAVPKGTETDLNQFELPPPPPQGTFDIRYSSQRYVEKLSTPQLVEMSGMEYPAMIRAEGVNILLSDETGKKIAALTDGEEITLAASPGKLYISENVMPLTYSLEQNYPNPFNPATTIQFSIPEDVHNVMLIIYNALGENIAELVNSKLEAGTYRYDWNASDAASGLYIYQIVTEKFVTTRKMILLK